jgi:hypothetical protein
MPGSSFHKIAEKNDARRAALCPESRWEQPWHAAAV